MGDVSEGSRKDWIKSAGPGINVKGDGTVGVNLWKRDLGGDQGDDQGTDSVPLSDGTTDHRYDGKTWGRRRVGVSSGRGGDGIRGVPPHWSIHQEVVDDHNIEGGLTDCL